MACWPERTRREAELDGNAELTALLDGMRDDPRMPVQRAHAERANPADELRIESFFPVDEASARLLQALAALAAQPSE